MNTLSEIEEYYKAREQQLLEKLHQQEAASAAMPDGYPSCPERRITAAQLSSGRNKIGERKAQMKHRISRRAFLHGCTLLAASAAVGSLTSCGGTNAKDGGLPQIIVGSDTYPPYIYLNNDGVPAGIDVEIATEAFRRMGYAARFETINWEQKTNLVESGAITEDEARVHPQRNLITRVVGVHPEVECDYGCYKFEPGDLALSCTDGLSNYLERDTLLLFISNYQGEELADELIRYANSKGGSDNVTVAVIENR